MQTISYKQACELLGVKYVTIKDAVLYGRLTKCAGVTGSLLLRQQVELFRGKKISPSSLTLEEKTLWEEYKKIAENADLLKLATAHRPQQNDLISIRIARQTRAQGEEKTRELINSTVNHLLDIIAELRMIEAQELELSYPQ